MNGGPAPIIGISMGDPSGIGPEVIVKALRNESIYGACRPVVIGATGIMAEAVERFSPDATLLSIPHPNRGDYRPFVVNVMNVVPCDAIGVVRGAVCAESGRASFFAVRELIRLAQEGVLDATVTAPINKEAIRLAGFPFDGHTEMFAHFTGAQRYAMMLVAGSLRVVHVSTHVPMRDACGRVRKERILLVTRLGAEAVQRMGIARPRIAVAGLNPHAGENGLFGREEMEEIRPAVEAARAEGLSVEGPLPPDTVFARAMGGAFDLVVAMYHDQGHIPVKLSWFVGGRAAAVSGVNITLGLPLVRVSVDHGTAFDIAGTGAASELSMVEAIVCAAMLAGGRAR